MAAPIIIPAKFTAIDSFTPVFKKMTAAGTTFTTKMTAGFNAIALAERKVRRGLVGITNKLGSIGKLGFAVGGLTILTAIGSANVELDNSLQSLQAITGLKGTEFVDFRKEIDAVSKSQKIFSANTAQAFELVGSAKPELLASADALGRVTESALILSKAGKLEVVDAVGALTVSMNQFGAGADKASEFVDILATAQQKGSGTIQFLSEAMVNAGGTSKAFGNSFADTVAILEGFAKAGVPASEAGNQLAGILAKLSTSTNKNFNPQFTKATDIIDNLSKANLSYNELLSMTDIRGAKWLTTIINQNQIVQELTGNLYEVENAQSQANTQTSSLGFVLKELTDSFKNQVTSTDESNVSMSVFKGILITVTDNMGLLIGTIGTAIGVYLALKIATIAITFFTGLYNVALGLNAARLGYSSIAMGTNTVAIGVMNVATKAITLGTWLWTAATSAAAVAMAVLTAPITLIILGIIALIALVTLIIVKYNEWGAALSLLLGPLGMIINLIQSFRRNWEMVTDAFTNGGIMAGIKAIGIVIFDSILMPIQQLLGLIEKVTGIDVGSNAIGNFRTSLGLDTGEGQSVSNPDAAIERVRTEREERSINNRTVNELLIKTQDGVNAELSGSQDVPIMLTPTM